jgi:hypothetical protein
MAFRISAPRVAALTVLLSLPLAAPAEALKFEPVDPKLLPAGVKSALWVRDCGKQGFRDGKCEEAETQFFQGDSVRLARELTGRQYDEIWLASGGGSLDEGIGVGEVLRRFQATVRIPPGYRCVSACTTAFLGGVFRFIDEGATYQVHAGSWFLEESVEENRMKAFLSDPGKMLTAWFQRLSMGENLPTWRFKSARETAHALFLHCQKALLPLGILAPGQETANRNVFANLLRSSPPRYSSAQLADDVARINREGIPAAQNILMRIEVDLMTQAIEELRAAVPSLGPRAEPALRILETMYSSRITGTATLSRQTMIQMGYITEMVNLPR